MKKQLLFILVMLLPLMASAHDIEVQNGDGKTIYYNFTNDGTELAVTFQGNYYLEYKDEYRGNVVIPQEVCYMNSTYKVTSVGEGAFYNCSGLTSVTIPNIVTSIGSMAFYNCNALTSVIIPNNVTSIDAGAFYSCSGFTSVTIPNSVTSIGENAFKDCSKLKKVIVSDIAAWCGVNFGNKEANPLNYARHLYSDENTEIMDLVIPNSVTSIGGNAFCGCSSLTSVTIPNSVSSIGGNAFYGCSSLTSVTIPNSVTSIGGNAFYYCSSLTSVTIGNSVMSIGENAFEKCSGLKKVIVPDIATWCGINFGNYVANPLYYARHIYSDDNTEIKDLCIPNGVTNINDYSFSECSGLTSVTIGNSVMSIGDWAFSNCSGLTSVTIGNSVTSIGNRAFWQCSGLTSIIIPNSVESIGNLAFDNCDGLTSVTIGNSVTSIGECAFYVCSHLRSVTIGNSVKSIGRAAFSGCGGLISMVIPSSVVSIEEDAFNYCTRLKELIFEDGEDSLQFLSINPTKKTEVNWFKECPLDSIYLGRNIYNTPFTDNDALRTVTFGNKVNAIPGCIFLNCIQLNHVELSNSITKIGSAAFQGCKNLKNFVIPQNITNIENAAFNSSGLSSLIIEESENILYFEGRNIFSGCPLTNIYLGRNFGGAPFSYNYSFQYITIGSKVTELNEDIFYERTGIKNLIVEKGENPLVIRSSQKLNYGTYRYYTIMPFSKTPIDTIFVDRTLISRGSDDEVVYLSPFYGVPSSYELIFGDEIKELADYCFKDNNITSIRIPKNLKKIGNSCFSGCVNLRTINIEDCEESLEIGDEQTFYQCSLDSIYLGRNLAYNYNKSPFPSSRERLKKLNIGNYVKEINDYMFIGFKSLLSIDLPKNLTKIGKQAFYDCEGLTTLTIPSSVKEIGQQAFEKCRELKNLVIEDGEEGLAFTAEPNFINNAFLMSPLEDIYIGRNFIYQYVSPFSALESIKELTLGSKVTRLGDGAFAACPNLKAVYSNTETVPTTEGYIFTESYLADATLFVPYSLYDEYRVTYPWNKFGNMINDEGKYNLFYMVDEVEYKKYVVKEGDGITPETEPTKEGYTFNGWSEIPDSMPAHDVIVKGAFSINKYKLIYNVDGEEYQSYDLDYGSSIIPEDVPIKEGYTFSGWSEIPETMPAHDVTVAGSFSINSYKLTYMLNNEVYKEMTYEYGATVTPEPQPEGDYASFEWIDLPQTMPAHDVVVYAMYTSGITDVLMKTQQNVRIYTPNGKKLNKLQKGLNIVVLDDGTVKKVVVK